MYGLFASRLDEPWRIRNHHRWSFEKDEARRSYQDTLKMLNNQKINRQLLTQEGSRHREGAIGDDEKKERERKEKKRFAAMTRSSCTVLRH